MRSLKAVNQLRFGSPLICVVVPIPALRTPAAPQKMVGSLNQQRACFDEGGVFRRSPRRDFTRAPGHGDCTLKRAAPPAGS